MYWNKETGVYDLMRQLQDMADARERIKDIPLPKLSYIHTGTPNNLHKLYNEIIPPLPPLKVFLGWTPMNEFINKCKPFVKTRYVFPHSMGIGISVIKVEARNSDLNDIYKRVYEALGVKIENQGNDKR